MLSFLTFVPRINFSIFALLSTFVHRIQLAAFAVASMFFSLFVTLAGAPVVICGETQTASFGMAFFVFGPPSWRAWLLRANNGPCPDFERLQQINSHWVEVEFYHRIDLLDPNHRLRLVGPFIYSGAKPNRQECATRIKHFTLLAHLLPDLIGLAGLVRALLTQQRFVLSGKYDVTVVIKNLVQLQEEISSLSAYIEKDLQLIAEVDSIGRHDAECIRSQLRIVAQRVLTNAEVADLIDDETQGADLITSPGFSQNIPSRLVYPRFSFFSPKVNPQLPIIFEEPKRRDAEIALPDTLLACFTSIEFIFDATQHSRSWV